MQGEGGQAVNLELPQPTLNGGSHVLMMVGIAGLNTMKMAR